MGGGGGLGRGVAVLVAGGRIEEKWGWEGRWMGRVKGLP